MKLTPFRTAVVTLFLFCASAVIITGGISAEETKLPLEGIKICLDPGHGGTQTGAVGPQGLKESDVNLKEARMLKEMLEEAGAEVVMTRNDDSNVSLTDRWKFNRAENTDLFVSLHHNANAQNDKSMNRTEVFYHWKDRGGPSRDIAYILYRELQATMDLPDSKPYMCWAYGVLRENAYPAVLAEPSYLANPEEEKRLRNDKYLRKIAEAYYRAILEFFEGGRPEIKADDNLKVSDAGVIEVMALQPKGTAMIDPQRFTVKVDDQYVDDLVYDMKTGELEIILPRDMETGKHNITISARNLVGHVSDVYRGEFELEKEISKNPKSYPAILKGVLRDKKIVLDPQGGGGQTVAIAENGLRASYDNLDAALYLFDYLKRAGTDVSITRRIDKAMDNVNRVRFGLERNPDTFMSIGHRLPEPGMGEEPGTYATRIGSRWSTGREIGKAMIYHIRQILGTGKQLGDPTSREPLKGEVHNWSSWEVMHAAQNYSAFHVSPIMFDAPGATERLTSTAGPRKEALAMLYGLAAYFGLDDREMAMIRGKVTDAESGAPLQNALLFLDENLIIQTEKDGEFLFKFLEPGKHEIRIMRNGYKTVTRDFDLKKTEKAEAEIKLQK